MAQDFGEDASYELFTGVECDPQAVLKDVQEGALTVREARQYCGVVFVGTRGEPDFAVNEPATERIRSDIRATGAAPNRA